MRILLATSQALPSGGGIASYNQELIRLLGKDNRFYLITDANEHNVSGYVDTISIYGKKWKSYDYCVEILKQINTWEIDLIINSNSALLAVLAPFIQIPIISISHFVNGKIALTAGYNGNYVSTIIALSNYGKEYIINKFNISNPQKVKVVYNFVADKQVGNLTHKKDAFPLTIVYPGGTSTQKSVDVVMRTLYRLLKTNLSFNFIWLGDTLLPLSKLSSHKFTTQFFQNDSRVKIVGVVHREESINYIESANIFLLPSRGEGCPMTLLEAIRAGCIPIVSDSKHGSREILEAGNFGTIVKQGDDIELYCKIVDIIKNHKEYKNDYDLSYQYSRSSLSQEVWNNLMDSIIKDAINSSKITKEFTPSNFHKSIKGYTNNFRIERIKEIFLSFRCRVYFEWLYYFVS